MKYDFQGGQIDIEVGRSMTIIGAWFPRGGAWNRVGSLANDVPDYKARLTQLVEAAKLHILSEQEKSRVRDQRVQEAGDMDVTSIPNSYGSAADLNPSALLVLPHVSARSSPHRSRLLGRFREPFKRRPK